MCAETFTKNEPRRRERQGTASGLPGAVVRAGPCLVWPERGGVTALKSGGRAMDSEALPAGGGVSSSPYGQSLTG